jgi:selenide,water dikinase
VVRAHRGRERVVRRLRDGRHADDGDDIVGWPQELPPSVLAQVLRGGAEKIAEAGAILVGGHSVRDKEVKYGLSVTGTVHPDRITTNAGARVGDVLVLTKPLGMGAAATAMKLDKLPPEWIEPACMQMAHLNKGAAEAAATVDCKAATDVTGFGLMGHGRGMAEASGVTLEFVAAALPLFPVALELAAQKLTSGGATRTRAFLGATAEIGPGVDPLRALLAFDAETSGGMLICVAEDRVERLLRELAAQGTPCAAVGPGPGAGVAQRPFRPDNGKTVGRPDFPGSPCGYPTAGAGAPLQGAGSTPSSSRRGRSPAPAG